MVEKSIAQKSVSLKVLVTQRSLSAPTAEFLLFCVNQKLRLAMQGVAQRNVKMNITLALIIRHLKVVYILIEKKSLF
jgi:hypothetical protein